MNRGSDLWKPGLIIDLAMNKGDKFDHPILTLPSPPFQNTSPRDLPICSKAQRESEDTYCTRSFHDVFDPTKERKPQLRSLQSVFGNNSYMEESGDKKGEDQWSSEAVLDPRSLANTNASHGNALLQCPLARSWFFAHRMTPSSCA